MLQNLQKYDLYQRLALVRPVWRTCVLIIYLPFPYQDPNAFVMRFDIDLGIFVGAWGAHFVFILSVSKAR